MATSPRAIPVRTRTRVLRNMCIEADPEFIEESENPEEYQFSKRTFRGRYKHRGAYADED
jgi:hypothetical protein